MHAYSFLDARDYVVDAFIEMFQIFVTTGNILYYVDPLLSND
jgi:hypothetical protein